MKTHGLAVNSRSDFELTPKEWTAGWKEETISALRDELKFILKVQKMYGEEALNKCFCQFSGRGSYKKINDMPPQTIRNFVFYLELLVQDAS